MPPFEVLIWRAESFKIEAACAEDAVDRAFELTAVFDNEANDKPKDLLEWSHETIRHEVWETEP